VRVVLDPNILIAALLSADGAPAVIVRRWLAGEFELIVSPALLDELGRVLGYPKLRRRIGVKDAAEFLAVLAAEAVRVRDPSRGTYRSPDAGDDYLLALAEQEHAVLVSGDAHLLELDEGLPIMSARAFLDAYGT
jgi:putative PIN family toxin of toxin-antitoxin system